MDTLKKDKIIRTPKQARSIETKNKILKTALKLFCSKGFYKTTTNEIAKEADVPIGSLYSYFKNKDTILIEILEDYNDSFINKIYTSYASDSFKSAMNDKKAIIRDILISLINAHKESRELNLELKALSISKPEVAKVLNEQEEKIHNIILDELVSSTPIFKINDIEACAIVLYDIINSVVDRVVFKNSELNGERIINTAVEAIYKYLFL